MGKRLIKTLERAFPKDDERRTASGIVEFLPGKKHGDLVESARLNLAEMKKWQKNQDAQWGHYRVAHGGQFLESAPMAWHFYKDSAHMGAQEMHSDAWNPIAYLGFQLYNKRGRIMARITHLHLMVAFRNPTVQIMAELGKNPMAHLLEKFKEMAERKGWHPEGMVPDYHTKDWDGKTVEKPTYDREGPDHDYGSTGPEVEKAYFEAGWRKKNSVFIPQQQR